jgi:hypothetical protein
MVNFVPISSERHADKAWRRPQDFGFLAEVSLAPLVAADLARAALMAPITFVEQDGRMQLALMLSPIAGDNLFVDAQGRWLGAYVPLSLRTHPFRLLVREDTGEAIMCVDEDSGLVCDPGPGTEPIVGEDGQLSESLQPVLQFLAEIAGNRRATDVAVAALSAAKVIKPWDLKVRQNDTEVPINGLFRVDEASLMELPDSTFLELRKVGALPLAYAHILSLALVESFARLIEARSATARAMAAAPAAQSTMLSEEMIESALAALGASQHGT